MANMCSNVVWFTAGETTMQKLKELFLQMAGKEQATGNGQLPDFITEQQDWFFDTSWEEEDVLYYQTRWSPNLEQLVAIAEHFGCGFTCEYSETGNLVFGSATYGHGNLTDTYLEPEDFEKYDYNEQTDNYCFEGNTFESDYEILEILLERKIKGL